MTVLAEILDDGTAVGAVRADEWFETGMNKLMPHQLSTHRELLGAQITRECFLAVTTHVTAQAFHRCTPTVTVNVNQSINQSIKQTLKVVQVIQITPGSTDRQ